MNSPNLGWRVIMSRYVNTSPVIYWHLLSPQIIHRDQPRQWLRENADRTTDAGGRQFFLCDQPAYRANADVQLISCLFCIKQPLWWARRRVRHPLSPSVHLIRLRGIAGGRASEQPNQTDQHFSAVDDAADDRNYGGALPDRRWWERLPLKKPDPQITLLRHRYRSISGCGCSKPERSPNWTACISQATNV